MKNFRNFISESVKVGWNNPENNDSWNSHGHKEIANDVKGSSHTLTKDTKIRYAKYHNHHFESGVPVLKYFDRSDEGYNGSKTQSEMTLKKGTKIVKKGDHSYSHHPDHGYVRWNHGHQF